MSDAVNSVSDPRTKGWLQEQLATYAQHVDPARAQQALAGASKLNPRVLRPRHGVSYRRIAADLCVINTYNSSHQLLTQSTPHLDGAPAVEQWVYNGPFSLLSSYTNPDGDVTAYGYTAAGDLQTVTHPNGGITTYTHNQWGQIDTTSIQTSPGATAVVVLDNTFDSIGRVTSSLGPVLNNPVTNENSQLRVDTTYNDLNLVTFVEETNNLSTPVVAPRQASYIYDRQGREISATVTASGTITRDFDDRGNIIRVCDARTNCVRSDFNNLNQITATWAESFKDSPTDPTPTTEQLSAATYDLGGRLDTSTDALGRVNAYSYDNADRRTDSVLLNMDGTGRNVRLESVSYNNIGYPDQVSYGGDIGSAALRTVTTDFTPGGLPEHQRVLRATGGDHLRTNDYWPSGKIKTETVTFDTTGVPFSETNYEYTNGLLTRSTQTRNVSADPVTEYSYDGLGRMLSMTDAAGNTTGYTVDPAGRATHITGAAVPVNGSGSVTPVTKIGFDLWGNVTHHQDAEQRVTLNSYDQAGRISTIDHPTYTTPAGQTITAQEVFNYDPNGNLINHNTRRGYDIAYQYDDLNRRVQTTRLIANTSRDSFVTYDLVGNVTSTTSFTGARIDYGYNDLNLVDQQDVIVRTVTLPNAGGTLAGATYTTTFTYDDLGQLYTETDPNAITITYGYDEVGNLRTRTDADLKTTTWTHNHLGQVLTETDPMGRSTVNEYDQLGNMLNTKRVDPSGNQTQQVNYLYTLIGQPYQMTDSLGGRTDYYYDEHNRLERVRVWTQATSAGAMETFYGYNLTGALTYQKDAKNNVTTHTVNVWDLRETTVEAATTAHPNVAQRTFTVTYDADGQVTQTLDAYGYWVDIGRDELGRVLTEDASNTSHDNAFAYDADGRLTYAFAIWGRSDTYTYDDRGLIVESHNTKHTVTYAYDNGGRLTNRTETATAGGAVTHAFAWTNQNELYTHADPLTGLTATYTYNNASQPTVVAFTNATSNRGTRSYEYTPFGDLDEQRINASFNGTLIDRTDYTYNARGDLTAAERYARGQGTRIHTYNYDPAQRLTDWTVTNTANTALHDVAYTYDDAGNKQTETINGVTGTYTYDERNQLLSDPDGTTYAWRANGTLYYSLTNGTRTYRVFDSHGRIRSTFEQGQQQQRLYHYYDSHNRMLRRIDQNTNDDTSFYFNSTAPEPSRSTSAQGTNIYSRLPNSTLTTLRDTANNNRIIGQNQHGDLHYLYDPDIRNTKETITYTPYGKTHQQWGTDPNPELGYQTQYTDPTTGDVLMQARWYSPGTASFRSRDTWAGDLNTPVTLNRYTYAGNNPIRYWDPTGYEPEHAQCGFRGKPCPGAIVPKHSASHNAVDPALVGAHEDAVIYASTVLDDAGQVTTASEGELLLLFPSGYDSYEGAPAQFESVTLYQISAAPDWGRGVNSWIANVDSVGKHGLSETEIPDWATFVGSLIIPDVNVCLDDPISFGCGMELPILDKVDSLADASRFGIKAFKGGDETLDSLVEVRRLGQEGELLAGINKNTERIPSASGSAAYRIPDGLDHGAQLLQEVKNVASLSYTKQLRDFSAYAQANGYRFELFIRPSTQLSGPLQDAVARGEIVLRFLP